MSHFLVQYSGGKLMGGFLYTVVTPGLLQKKYKKSLTVREYLVVFLGVFFRKFAKKM